MIGESPMERQAMRKPDFSERVAAWFKARANSYEGEQSVRDLFQGLDSALRATEPGYMWVEDVYPDSMEVVYYCSPGEEWQCYRRTYETDDAGKVTLSDDREEVELVSSYKPVAAEAATSPCSCGGQQGNPAHAEPTEGERLMEKKDRVKALVDKKLPGVTKKFLESLSDDQLAVIEADAKDVIVPVVEEEVETPPVVVNTPAAPPVAQLSAADFMKIAPQSIRDLVAREESRETSRKTSLLALLKGKVNGVYSDAELDAMGSDQLEKIAVLAGQSNIDYSGRGASIQPPVSDVISNPPDGWAHALEQRKHR